MHARVRIFLASRNFKPVEKVRVACDGGTSSMKAVDHIARSPLFQGLRVPVATMGRETDEASKGLADAAALLHAAGLGAESAILSDQPETALPKLVDKQGVDMLVMGVYRNSRIRPLIIASNTGEMIRSCKVPVVQVG